MNSEFYHSGGHCTGIQDVAQMLLPLHLDYMNEFSGGQQTAGWLSEKAMVHKIKFKTDQKLAG